MKKSLSLLTLVVCLLSSCNKDDELQIGLNGTLTLNGEAFQISNGLYATVAEDGYFAASFILSDSPITYDESTDNVDFEGNTLITVTIFSQSDGFDPGEYPVIDLLNSSSDITKGALAFAINVNDGTIGGFATGGTINITGSGNSYNFTFDVNFDGDVTLTGNAGGGFELANIPVD